LILKIWYWLAITIRTKQDVNYIGTKAWPEEFNAP